MLRKNNEIIFTAVLVSLISFARAYSSTSPTVTELLSRHAATITELKSEASSITSTPPTSEIFYLRYCLTENDNETPTDMETIKKRLAVNLKWRANEGKSIVEAASNAVSQSSSGASWENNPVRNLAPNADLINKFISSKQILTTTSRSGDLVYCIRAGKIDDVSLMSSTSIEQMVDFFLYCKEVHSLVADDRSEKTGVLVRLITMNDLYGLKLIGGSADFRSALSEASKKANELYPNLITGPTLLLNLPKLVRALVKVFTPLFPEKVRKNIKFEKGMLADVNDLMDVGPNGARRDEFLDEVDNFVYAVEK